jgi:hypothetical protein
MAEGMRPQALLLANVALMLAALVLGACDGGQTTSSAPATTSAPTTTTLPDPAAAACSKIGDDPNAVDDLRTSRDTRIAQAARDLDEVDGVDGERVRAVEELVRACQAAGYLPR